MEAIEDRALAHGEHLAVGIGNRPVRYSSHLGMAVYISEVFTNRGLFPERQAIAYPDWVAEKISIGTVSISLTHRGNRDIDPSLSDTVPWMSGEKLAEAIRFAPELFEELDHQDLSWSRPKM